MPLFPLPPLSAEQQLLGARSALTGNLGNTSCNDCRARDDVVLDGGVDVDLDSRVGGLVCTWELNRSWVVASTAGNGELIFGYVSLSAHLSNRDV